MRHFGISNPPKKSIVATSTKQHVSKPKNKLLPQINTLVPALQICYPLRPAAAFCSLGGRGESAAPQHWVGGRGE